MSPTISIIIPTYNRADILENTLETVINQTYKRWECLVVDDFSSDNTEEIVKSYEIIDGRFFYLKNAFKKGASGARNSGLLESRGEFVIFLDSDDLLLPHCLQERYTHFQKDPELDLLIANQKRLINGIEGNYVNIKSCIDPLVRFFSMFPNCDIPWVNNVLIRKSFLSKNKISWNETLERYQDIDFNIRILISKPIWKWSESEVDSYWTYQEGTPSIGTNANNEFDKLLGILKVYWRVLQEIDHSCHTKKMLIRQYHSLLCWLLFNDYKGTKIHRNRFIQFLQTKSELSLFELSVLRLWHFTRLVPVAAYSHELLTRKIEKHFIRRYRPVVEVGHFLKENNLS